MSTINEFSKESDNIILGFEKKDAPSGLLFHYRKFQHAESIIATKELRYADFKLLDDKQEIKLGHEEISKLIGMRDKKSKYFWYYMDREFEKIIQNQSIYTLSLSCQRYDEQLLTTYSDNGTGMILGFNFKIGDNVNITKFSDAKHLLKVIYIKDLAEFHRRINMLLDLADKYLEIMPETEEQHRELAVRLISSLCVFLPVLKENKFDWETEYRIVIPGLIDLKTNKRHPFEIFNESFRHTTKYQKHHVVCPFDPDELKEVLIGPNAEKDSEEKIRSLLESNGFNANEILASRDEKTS